MLQRGGGVADQNIVVVALLAVGNIIPKKEIEGGPPAQHHEGAVHDEVFVVHPPVEGPGQEKVGLVIEADFHIVPLPKRAEHGGAAMKHAAHAVPQDSDRHAPLGGGQ